VIERGFRISTAFWCGSWQAAVCARQDAQVAQDTTRVRMVVEDRTALAWRSCGQYGARRRAPATRLRRAVPLRVG